jgi:menaquinone-9 beta-reductase
VNSVCILGGGPAGASAAIAACRSGASVSIIERSRFPRHKVCGEFLSPGIEPALGSIGLWTAFQELRPAQIRRMKLRAGRAEKVSSLPETAYGLSRHRLDAWLWENAIGTGARHVSAGEPNVITVGRSSPSRRGGRLFGFKAHFDGPADDAVELFFAGSMYVGVNCVEDGITNVCGLASEEQLKQHGFEVDDLLEGISVLRERLGPLRRKWDWIFTGPLEFGNRCDASLNAYIAGDALSFVDPFTGSGLLCAIMTGTLAGRAAASSMGVAEYSRRCARLLGQPFAFSSALRRIAETRAAGPLLRFAPARLLFRLTRPHSF